MREIIKVKPKKNNLFINNKIVDYSCIPENYFIDSLITWKHFGIINGTKIGICIDKYQLLMPIILSLDLCICEIEFLNDYMLRNLTKSNFSSCNSIITNKKYNFDIKQIEEKSINLFNYKLYVYSFPEVKIKELKEKIYIFYTSGSTGVPKAIYKTEASIVKEGELIASELNITEEDFILCTSPCCHIFGQSIACIAALVSGAKVEYMNSLVSPNKVIKNMRKREYSLIVSTPLYYDFFVNYEEILKFKGKLITGGARVSDKVISSRINLFVFYGSTETGVISIKNIKCQKDKTEYVGRIVRGVNIVWGEEVEFNNEYQLRRIKIDSPFNAFRCKGNYDINFETGIVPLNDYGYSSNKNLYIYGRLDSILNVNGLKVSTTEIERVLESYPNVRKAKVIKKIERQREYPVAYVELLNKDIDNLDDLYSYCCLNLEHYKVPKNIVVVKSFNYSNTGKLILNERED